MKNNDKIEDIQLMHKRSDMTDITDVSDVTVSSWHMLGGGLSVQDSVIIKRLTLFTIVFILVWIFPLSDRIYTVITNVDAPFWLTILHHCGLGLTGLANCIVWSRSHQFQSFGKSYHMMTDVKEQTKISQFRDQLEYDTNL